MSTVGIVQKVPYVNRPPSSTTVDNGDHELPPPLGLTIALRRFDWVRKGIAHRVPFWNGGKRSVTYIFLHASPPLLLPPSRRHQLL